MRTPNRRPVLATFALLASGVLLTGCGDPGNQLPAGMTGASAGYAGMQGAGVDDPVLADVSMIDELDAYGTDDPFMRAASDWNGHAGAAVGIDDLGFDDGPLPIGYGDFDDGWGLGGGFGYGGSVLAAASMHGGWGGAAFFDGGFSDPGFMDAGFDDPGFDTGFDPGFVNAGFDAGFDPGFVDAGFDAGFDPGFDVGGFDPGFADVGGFDAGGFDAGGFDAGFGF
jgi:hypothetical protein